MTTEVRLPSRKTLNLKFRVKCFFRDHPDEELTPTDFRLKFGVTEATRRWLIVALAQEGLLESVHVIRLRSKGIAKEIT